jgi:hypothetical protein
VELGARPSGVSHRAEHDDPPGLFKQQRPRCGQYPEPNGPDSTGWTFDGVGSATTPTGGAYFCTGRNYSRFASRPGSGRWRPRRSSRPPRERGERDRYAPFGHIAVDPLAGVLLIVASRAAAGATAGPAAGPKYSRTRRTHRTTLQLRPGKLRTGPTTAPPSLSPMVPPRPARFAGRSPGRPSRLSARARHGRRRHQRQPEPR